MFRRDYIVRMIEEAAALLARIVRLQKENRQSLAMQTADQLVRELAASDLPALLALDESAIFAKLMSIEPSFAAREKGMILAAALHQAGQIYDAQDEPELAFQCHLKALNLLLGLAMSHDDLDLPVFIPSIDEVCAALGDSPLPSSTLIGLMYYQERFRFFDKACDTLRRLLQSSPADPELRELGAAFYQRLARRSDVELEEGGLSRAEVRKALAEFGKLPSS